MVGKRKKEVVNGEMMVEVVFFKMEEIWIYLSIKDKGKYECKL